jgi:hypothetical protein
MDDLSSCEPPIILTIQQAIHESFKTKLKNGQVVLMNLSKHNQNEQIVFMNPSKQNQMSLSKYNPNGQAIFMSY